MSGIIAIVGRPNVGKSALFNRIAGRRIAIVHDQPGVTRDRVSAELEWQGRPYTLIDTGGIGVLRGEKADDVITRAAYDQVQVAIESADVILFVVNVQEGIVPLDGEVAQRLRKSGRRVLLVINKVDQDRAETHAVEFDRLGFSESFSVSAIHGRGVETMLAAAMTTVSQNVDRPESTIPNDPPSTGRKPAAEVAPGKPEPEAPREALKLAFVGRPNVGKSSIVNALTRSERVIVSPVPGTTRDSVDVPFEVETDGVRQRYVLIDTAGMRKTRRIDDSIEFFSVQRSADAIARADVVILVLDAVSGILEQDKKIADVIVGKRRACVIVVNKWDLVAENVRKLREQELAEREKKLRNRDARRKRLTTLGEFGEWVQEKLFFLDYAPVIFTSAKDGFQLDRLLEAIRYVAAQLQQKIPTSVLNRTLNDAVEKRQPVSKSGSRLKFFYATQVGQAPPTFLLFVNRGDLFSDDYTKYLSREMRRAFGFEGCPIQLVPRARPKTIEPKRRPAGRQPKAFSSRGRRPTPNRRRS
jgi:GTP-binding protein